MKKINIIIILLFLIFSLLVGSKHEPWFDEAQSWMIARDASYFDIIWTLSRYEGTMPLWQFTLKFFISMGITYEYFFIVPIVVSLIGLVVFLKKVETPVYVKILLPFTYYIFYQYTIVARSYCYLLLGFSLVLITYKNRFKEPLKYILALAFLSLISMHGTIIFVCLGILFFIEKLRKKEFKSCIKEFIIFIVILIVEFAILFPSSDLYMTVSAAFSIPEIVKSILFVISGGENIFFKVYNILAFFILLFLFIKTCFLKNKDIPIITSIVFLFMFSIRFATHHGGIIFYLIIFGILAYYEELKECSKHFEKLFLIVLTLYSILSIQSGINDVVLEYSGAKEMATYIKEKCYHEKELFGFGYLDVSLQPYFEEKLYKNMDETVYKWSINNRDFYMYCNFEQYKKEDFTEIPEYIVVNWDENNEKSVMIEKMIMDTEKYEVEYRTIGYKIFKNYHSGTEGYTLYKLK